MGEPGRAEPHLAELVPTALLAEQAGGEIVTNELVDELRDELGI